MDLDRKGLIGTIAVHVVILAIFLFAGFRTPLPLPAEQGMLINFGDIEYAKGPAEPKKEQKQAKPTPKAAQPKPTPKVEEQVATQDFEEAPAVESSPKPVVKKTEPKKVEEKKVEPDPEPVEQPKTVNKSALYKGKKEDTKYTGSEGNTSGEGNMGSVTGSPDTQNRQQGLSSGDGISFSLEGRNPIALPTPEFNHQAEGKVVVEVTVDRSGRVTNAIPGVKGSTTLDSYLLQAAKKAALSSKFSEKGNAPFYQKGTITYYFKLK